MILSNCLSGKAVKDLPCFSHSHVPDDDISTCRRDCYCFLVKRGGGKGAEGKRGVGFHEDSLAAAKRWIYVCD